MLMFDDGPQAEKEPRVDAEPADASAPPEPQATVPAPTSGAEAAADASPADASPPAAETAAAAAPTAVAEPEAQRRASPAAETGQPADKPSPAAARPTPVPKASSGAAARPEREPSPEALDPRKRRPAQYSPPSGPSPSRFRPRQALTDVNLADINYKNVEVLSQFLDNQGRILSRRKTRVSAKMQRRIRSAIKQARYLALLPYTPSHIRSVRRR